MIVILGTKRDEHVRSVSACLDNLGVDHRVIDYLAGTEVSFTTDELGRLDLRIDGTQICGPTLIWDRRKMSVREFAIQGAPRAARYETMEWNAIYTLIAGAYGPNVVNPLASRSCMVKPYQQIVASRAGFDVPPTIVTNSLDEAREFCDSEPSLVLKSLSEAKVWPKADENPIPYHIMTMPVDSRVLDDATHESVGRCPHFFQRNLTKTHELRVVSIGSKLFPFRIDSQRWRTSSQDWRRAIPWLDFDLVELPPQVQSSIVRFLEYMGLFAGSFDLVLDDTGRYWFLECNQDGQWSWLDEIVGGEISKAYAEAFAERQSTP